MARRDSQDPTEAARERYIREKREAWRNPQPPLPPENDTRAEWLAYWAERALFFERKDEERAGARAAQARRRRIAIEAFHRLTRDRDGAPEEAMLRVDGRLERRPLPVSPEIALENVARWNERSPQAARRWLLDARAELPAEHPARSAPIPTGWSE